MQDKKKKGVKNTGPEPKLFPIEKLAKETALKSWELAGLRQYTGWMEGKQVTENQFSQALDSFRNRPQGGGRRN